MTTRTLSTAEITRLIALIRSHRHTERDLILIRLPLETGLRLAEVAGLDWTDILSVHEDILSSFPLRAAIAKRGKPATIRLNSSLRADLEAYHQWYTTHHGASTGPLLLSRHHRRLSRRQIERQAAHWLRLAGITGVTYHGLRHTFGCRVLARSRDIEATRRLLRHESITTTQIYVAHTSEDALAAAVEF